MSPSNRKRPPRRRTEHHVNEPRETPSPAMMKAHSELREAGRAVRELRAQLHEISGRHDELGAHLSMAWTEQEAMARDYQRLLLGILHVLDDCTQVLGANPEIVVVHAGLRRLLDEQGVESMPVNIGEPFDAELHENHETVTDADLPGGAVVDVVAPGYLRRAGNAAVVIRPAMVRVSTTAAAR